MQISVSHLRKKKTGCGNRQGAAEAQTGEAEPSSHTAQFPVYPEDG